MIDRVGIEFRSLAVERLACLRGGLPVWQAILVGQAHGMDEHRTAAHLQLTVEQVRTAFAFYAAFPDEIDGLLVQNCRGPEHLRATSFATWPCSPPRKGLVASVDVRRSNPGQSGSPNKGGDFTPAAPAADA